MPKRKSSKSPAERRESERLKKQRQRDSMTEEEKKQDRDRHAKQKAERLKRLDEEEAKRERERKTKAEAERVKRLDKEEAKRERNRHARAEAERVKRLDEEEAKRGRNRHARAEAERVKRLDEEDAKRERDRHARAEAERLKGLDEEEAKQAKKRHAEGEANRMGRKTPAETRETERMKKQRQRGGKTYQNRLEEFEDSIKLSPTIICSCCGGLSKTMKTNITREDIMLKLSKCRKKVAVQHHRIEDEEDSEDEDQEPNLLIDEELLDQVFYLSQKADSLCVTCYRHILKKQVPNLCLANGFDFPEIKEPLKDLSPLEERLIARRIPFMQIRGVGTERQLQLKGNVVNVENDLDSIEKIIPRNLTETSTVQLKFMRRVTDRSPYMWDVVRLHEVYTAAKYLKKHGPLYQDINLSENSSYTEAKEGETTRFLCEAGDEEEMEPKESEDEEDIDFGDGAEESLIYEDLEGLIIAPGKGKVPIPSWKDLNAEELSFPTIYCGKARRFKPELKITYTDIAKSELRRYDRRACTPTHILYAFRKSFNEKLRNQFQIFLRKSTQARGICAKDARNPEYIKNMIKRDDGYAILKTLRATPAYFQDKYKLARAMIRQCGKFTFFITHTAAETKWGDLLKTLAKVVDGVEIKTADDALKLDYETKARLIRSDPVTCMQVFDHRFRSMMNSLMKSDEGIFHPYKLEDYFTRMEFQMRGSPHVHGMYWVEDSPTYDPMDSSSILKCTEFIDQFVTCKKDETGKMKSLIGYQFHKHTHTCYKKNRRNRICRFGFPKPPMKATSILLPLDENLTNNEVEQHKVNWKKINDDLNERGRHPETSPEFEEYLSELGLSEADYIHAIRSSIRRPAVFLKRKLDATFINGYNKKLLEAWGANIDFQFVLDPYACARYCVGYIFKAEGGMSKLLRAAAHNARQGNITIKEKLVQFARILINGAEISVQEAAAFLLGIDYTHCSRVGTYVNTSMPEERTRILLPQNVLEKMEDGDDEIYAKGVIEHYKERPEEMKNMCLADFATLFDYVKSKPSDLNKLDSRGLKIYYELSSSGYMKRRTKGKRKILRFRNFGKENEPDNYWREQIMLFVPWKDEIEEVISVNPFSGGGRIQQMIEQNSEPFYADREIDEHVLLYYGQEYNADDDSEDEDDDLEFDDYLEESLFGSFKDLVPPERVDKETSIQKFLPPRLIDNETYYKIMRTLNKKQRRFVMNVIYLIKTGKLPFHFLLHGGAGVGKSHVITAIVQSLLRYYSKLASHNPEEMCVLVTAFTGKAAFNVFGMTVHTAFRLPPTQRPGATEKLDESVANTLRSKLAGVKVFIVDEISMVAREHLYDINTRLQQIYGNKEDYGGRSFIGSGHFRQLPPIGSSLIFTPPRHHPFGELMENHLWKKFEIFELDEIMRQKGAYKFCKALNNLPETKMKTGDEDEALMKSRKLTQHNQPPPSAIWLFKYVKQCNEHNQEVHAKLNTKSATSFAIDKLQGRGTDQQKMDLLEKAKTWNQQQASGLAYRVHLQVHGLYFISTNIDISDGLFNGATGELMDIDIKEDEDGSRIPIRSWLLMDNEFIGTRKHEENLSQAKNLIKSCNSESDRQELAEIIRKLENYWTPVTIFKRKLTRSRGSGLQLIRRQIPLVASNAMTIAKAQGCTMKGGAVVCLKVPERMRKLTVEEIYTACSRPPSEELLWIDGDFIAPEERPPNHPITLELERMRANCQLQFSLRFLEDVPETLFKLYFHNIQSFMAHRDDLLPDPCPNSADVLAFVEPHLSQDIVI